MCCLSIFHQVKFALPTRPKPIIILLEDLSPSDLTSAAPDLAVLVKSGGRVLRWNEAGFWNKLRFYLPDPRPTLTSTLAVRNKTSSGPIGTMGLLVRWSS